MQTSSLEWYKGRIRQTLAILGVDQSIERKVLAAVAIQFGVSVGQTVVALTVDGFVGFVLALGLLVGAGVAFANTVFITREDIAEPVTSLADSADRIAAGDVDVTVPSSDQPDEVGRLVQELQTEAARTATDVGEMNAQVSDSTATIESTLRDFEDVVDAVDDLDDAMAEISDATADQAETTQEVVAMVDEAAGVSERTSAEAERVAAAAQQQTASVTEVNDDLGTVAERTDELMDLLDRFELGGHAATVGSERKRALTGDD